MASLETSSPLWTFSAEARSALQPSPPPPVLASQHRLPVCQIDRFSRFYYVFRSLNGPSDLPSPSQGSPRSSEGGRWRGLGCHPPDWAGCHCNSCRYPVFALSRELIVFCFCCVFTANDSGKMFEQDASPLFIPSFRRLPLTHS